MKCPLHALIVEDSPDDAEMLLMELSRYGFLVTAERVETREDLMAALEKPGWDIILSDHYMPQFSSTGVLGTIKHADVDVPCIIVSGASGEEAAIAAMHNGAADYILKDNMARLGPAVERELREAEMRRKRQQAEETIAYMAYYDPLTGLPNRTLLQDRFSQAAARRRRHQNMVVLMFLDVDRFKKVNDSLGHSAGDQVLQDLGKRLSRCVR
jgi:PleD family two-component response regulator